MEAEDFAELLAALRHVYTQGVQRHGGLVVRAQGDGVLAVFGHPVPHETDGRRAVEAALDLHREVATLTGLALPEGVPRLSLHSGVHAGLVFVQDGDLVLGRLELVGMAPNVAARLSDAAEADEILVSDESLGPDLHHFSVGPPRAVVIDSRGTVVPSRSVLGLAAPITSLQARTRRGLQPFIGRADELRRLHAERARAAAGCTRQVVISAPPGVGKTRLAEQFMQRAQADGWRVLKGHCADARGVAPLQPLAQMLRSSLGLPAEAGPERVREALLRQLAEQDQAALAAPLGQVLSLPAAEGSRPLTVDAVLDALRLYLEAVAARAPLLLFLDDWQWADAASRQGLAALSHQQRHVPLLVLATARSIEAADAALHQLQVLSLQPFTADEAAESVRRLAPRADPFVAGEIWRYSGGNALYIEELCHSAAQDDMSGWLARQHGGAAWLNVLVESRVARLPATQATLVRMAAVVGNMVPLALLRTWPTRPTPAPRSTPTWRRWPRKTCCTPTARPSCASSTA